MAQLLLLANAHLSTQQQLNSVRHSRLASYIQESGVLWFEQMQALLDAMWQDIYLQVIAGATSPLLPPLSKQTTVFKADCSIGTKANLGDGLEGEEEEEKEADNDVEDDISDSDDDDEEEDEDGEQGGKSDEAETGDEVMAASSEVPSTSSEKQSAADSDEEMPAVQDPANSAEGEEQAVETPSASDQLVWRLLRPWEAPDAGEWFDAHLLRYLRGGAVAVRDALDKVEEKQKQHAELFEKLQERELEGNVEELDLDTSGLGMSQHNGQAASWQRRRTSSSRYQRSLGSGQPEEALANRLMVQDYLQERQHLLAMQYVDAYPPLRSAILDLELPPLTAKRYHPPADQVPDNAALETLFSNQLATVADDIGMPEHLRKWLVHEAADLYSMGTQVSYSIYTRQLHILRYAVLQVDWLKKHRAWYQSTLQRVEVLFAAEIQRQQAQAEEAMRVRALRREQEREQRREQLRLAKMRTKIVQRNRTLETKLHIMHGREMNARSAAALEMASKAAASSLSAAKAAVTTPLPSKREPSGAVDDADKNSAMEVAQVMNYMIVALEQEVRTPTHQARATGTMHWVIAQAHQHAELRCDVLPPCLAPPIYAASL